MIARREDRKLIIEGDSVAECMWMIAAISRGDWEVHGPQAGPKDEEQTDG